MCEIDKTLVCRVCQREPETLLMEDDTVLLRCPGCGVERTRDEAIMAAGKYFSRQLVHERAEANARRTRGLKYIQRSVVGPQ